jgi:hypothetical protein
MILPNWRKSNPVVVEILPQQYIFSGVWIRFKFSLRILVFFRKKHASNMSEKPFFETLLSAPKWILNNTSFEPRLLRSKT